MLASPRTTTNQGESWRRLFKDAIEQLQLDVTAD
jgi:hypothetical protein